MPRKLKVLLVVAVAIALTAFGGRFFRGMVMRTESAMAAKLRPLVKRSGIPVPGRMVEASFEAPQSTPAREIPVLRYHEVVRPKRLDAWEIIGPGGGGTFYHPRVSPHDPKLVFATTDMTQCFVSENGGATWREFNLRAPCLVFFDAKLANRVYAQSQTGLWRSEDRGHTWNLVYPFPKDAVPAVYVDDEAEPFTRVVDGSVPRVTSFAVDPADSERLYIVIGESLRMSEDGGKLWKMLGTCNGCQFIYVDPASPVTNRKLWFVGSNSTAIWDGAKLTTGLKEPGGKDYNGHAYGVGASGKPVLYAVSDFYQQGGLHGGVVATDDGGITWRSLNDGIIKLAAPNTHPEFSAVGTSFSHPQVIYASVYHLNLPNDKHQYYGVIKTTDGGKNWTVVRKEESLAAENMHDSWMTATFGPDFGEQPLGIGVDPHNPDLVYTTDLGRMMRSTDGGKNWDAVYSQGTDQGYTTTGLDVTTCYGVHFDPFNPKRMFITYTDIGLFRSEDGGQSWMNSSTHGVPRAWWNTAYWVEFDPAVRGRMWAAMSRTHDLPRYRLFASKGRTASFQGGVVVSDDGGRSWTNSSTGLPSLAPTHILMDPRSPTGARVLYVAGFGRGVFKSTDGGHTWKAKSHGLPEVEPLTWRMAMDRNGTLYVVTIRRSQDGKFGNDGDGWLFRSRDGAENWERVPLPAGVNGPVGITVDPQDPQRLYLSAWGRYTLYSIGGPPPDGGVFLSTDGGQHWKNSLDASRRIYDVTVDTANPNVVYAVGFEASAWRSADRGQTWTRIRGYNFKDGHRAVIDPADHSKIYITTFGSSVWHGPAMGDPNAREDIAIPPALQFGAPPR